MSLNKPIVVLMLILYESNSKLNVLGTFRHLDVPIISAMIDHLKGHPSDERVG